MQKAKNDGSRKMRKKITSIGNSRRTKPKDKNRKKNFKAKIGQGSKR